MKKSITFVLSISMLLGLIVPASAAGINDMNPPLASEISIEMQDEAHETAENELQIDDFDVEERLPDDSSSENTDIQTYSGEKSGIEALWYFDENYDQVPMNVTPLSDTVFYVRPPEDQRACSIEGFAISGRLSEGETLESVYTGVDLPENYFDLTADGALKYEDDNSFFLDLYYAVMTTTPYPTTYFPTHYMGLCLYIKTNKAVYTLVIDTEDTVQGATRLVMPFFVGLYDIEHEEYLEEDKFQILDIPNATRILIQDTLASDEPLRLKAQVYNGGQNAGTEEVKATVQTLNRPDTARNWIILNGERLPSGADGFFFSGDEGESRNIFSPEFTLHPGINVIEVYTDLTGLVVDPKRSPNWIGLYSYVDTIPFWDPTTICATYVIDYQGEAAPAPEKSSDTDIAVAQAIRHGDENSVMDQLPFVLTGDGYSLTVPGTYRDISTLQSGLMKYTNHGVILSLKPSDPMAKVEVVDQTKTVTIGEMEKSGNLVAGIAPPCTALDLTYLNNDTFDIKVTADDGTVKIYPVTVNYAASDVDATGGTLTGENAALDVSFASDTLTYYVDFTSANPQSQSAATFTTAIPAGSTATLNGKPCATDNYGTVSCAFSPLEPYYRLTVTAEDLYTKRDYFFVTRYTYGDSDPSNDVFPFQTKAADTDAQAKRLLKGHFNDLIISPYYSSYWRVFMTEAVGIKNEAGDPFTFDGVYAYDVTKHNMKQATDPAACILQLVMLGENPYDFHGINFVAELEKYKYGGPFANNIWYFMAAQAVGIDPQFQQGLTDNALNPKYDVDMRSWCIAALSSVTEPKDMVRLIDGLHDLQNTSGDYTGMFKGFAGTPNNLYSNGCVLTAIASAGADPEYLFAYEKGGTVYTPLNTLEEKFASPDGYFWSSGIQTSIKDITVGLGDILNAGNVWARYALTNETYSELIEKAKGLGIDTSSMPVYSGYGTSGSGYGKAYYELYAKVADTLEVQGDYSMRPDVKWGMPYQIFEDTVNALPAANAITTDNLTEVKTAIDQYEALTDAFKGYVSDAVMEKYHAVVSAALAIQDEAVGGIYDRILDLPDPQMISADEKTEVEAVRAACNALSVEQRAIMDWAGASVLQKLVECENVFKGSSSGDPSKPTTMTILFELLGAPNDGENGTVHTLKAGNLETWYTTTQTFNSTSISAEDAFRLIMSKAGIEWRGDTNNEFGSIYVRGIKSPLTNEWMEEFTTTAKSGWMYTVNGKHPTVGLSNYTLYDDDTFVVHYTDDYTQEKGSENWSGGGTVGATTKPEEGGKVTMELRPEVIADKNGAANAVIDEKELNNTIADAKTEQADIIVIAPDVKGNASKVSVELPKSGVDNIAKQTNADLKVETDIADITILQKSLDDLAGQSGSKVSISVETRAGGGTGIEVAVDGKPVESLKGGLKAQLPAAKEGDVLVIVEPDGTETVVKKSAVENGHIEALLDGSCTVKVVDNSKDFADVADGAWYAGAVDFASSHELFDGVGGGAFAPGGTMTRGMLATVLWRLENEEEVTIPDTFTDVAQGSWYEDGIVWANEHGIVTGYGGGKFGPGDNITREQLAAMLWRYAKDLGMDVTAGGDLTAYTDSGSISGYAEEAMEWAVGAGLLTGKGNGVLDPGGNATRAEVATIMERLVGIIVK